MNNESAHQGDESPRAILIVDDSADDVAYLKMGLDQLGLVNPIRTVQTGADAIAYIEGSFPYSDRTKYPKPGIILLDLKLPGIDGFEVMEWLKGHSQASDFLVIAISGLDDLELIRRAYKMGANSFLAKPCRSADLEDLMYCFPVHWSRTTSANRSAE